MKGYVNFSCQNLISTLKKNYYKNKQCFTFIRKKKETWHKKEILEHLSIVCVWVWHVYGVANHNKLHDYYQNKARFYVEVGMEYII